MTFDEFKQVYSERLARFRSICSMYYVPLEEAFANDSRVQALTRARAACWAFMFDELGLSMSDVARVWNRDHATIAAGIGRFHERAGAYAASREDLAPGALVAKCPHCARSIKLSIAKPKGG